MPRPVISDVDPGVWQRVGANGSGKAVTFSGSAAHYDLTTWGPAEFRRVADEVQLRGSMLNAAAGAVALVFAAGWYPQRYVARPLHYAGSYFQLAPTTGFAIMVNVVANGWVPLDVVRFSLAPPTTS